MHISRSSTVFLFFCVWCACMLLSRLILNCRKAWRRLKKRLWRASRKQLQRWWVNKLRQHGTQPMLPDTSRRLAITDIPSAWKTACLHFVTKTDWSLAYSKEITINAKEEYIISNVRIIKSNIWSVYCVLVCQMTELAQAQIAGALTVPPVATDSSMLNHHQRDENQSIYTEQQQDKSDSDR